MQTSESNAPEISTSLGAALQKCLMLRVNLNVLKLAEHYQFPPQEMEMVLLALCSNELLALIPPGEIKSNRVTFDERVSSRGALTQKAIEEAVASIVEVGSKVKDLQMLHQRLSQLIQKMAQAIKT